MLNDLKKEFFSLKLLTALLIAAASVYLFQFGLEFIRAFWDIFLIIFFGWLVSFILEPFVDIFSKYLKLPRIASTALVFVLSAVLIVAAFIIFIPDIIAQFKVLEKVVPAFISGTLPQFQVSATKFASSFNNLTDYIPSFTQFFINLVTVLILSFYLVLEKKNLGKKLYAITPTKYHENIRFIDDVIDRAFASFVRLQVLWGFVGGITTYIVLTIFHVPFAASTSFLAGILSAVPMIGPIIGVIPPLLVTLISKPEQALIIFLIIFLIQQFIYNILGPKLIGKAFNINPIVVLLSLLIGAKVAGITGAIFAVPIFSIIMVIGREFYNHYFADKEAKIDNKPVV